MPHHSPPATAGPRRPDRRPGRAAARLLAAATTLVLAVSLTACSGDDEPSPTPGERSGESTATARDEKSLPEGLQRSRVEIGQVAGSLSRRHRTRLVAEVGGLVDRWFERSWLSTPMRTSVNPFPGFTPAAAQRARAHRHTTTIRAVGRPLGGVVPRTRGVRLDVLAPGGRPQAVTARFHLGLTAYDRQLDRLAGRAVVTGRLMLAPVGKHWRVFGFDVRTSLPKGTGKKKATEQDRKSDRKKDHKKDRKKDRKKDTRKGNRG